MIDLTPITDTTLVLVLSKPQENVAKWASGYLADAELLDCPLIVLFEDEAADDARTVARATGVEAIRLPEDESVDRLELIKAFASVYESIATTYFCITTVPSDLIGYFDTLKRHLTDARDRVNEVGVAAAEPILLYTRHDRALASRAYLWKMLSSHPGEIEPRLRDYLGYLALMHGALRLEGVDPVYKTGEIELFARASFGRPNTEQRPPWAYRLVISGRSRTEVHAEAVATLSQRVDNKGNRRWENLSARLPIVDVPDGNFRIMIGLETEHERLRVLRPLSPRPGVLACARTFMLRNPTHADDRVTRYLVHTIRKAPQTWITVQHGSGAEGRKRWYRAFRKKDIKLILRGRAAGTRMRLILLLRMLTSPFYRKKGIWLIGERADTAQDNGFQLFYHLRTEHPDRKVYYVIEKSSPHYSRVKPLGHVVKHSSWRHQLYMMHAHALANAYSIKHMLPSQWKHRAYTNHLAWRVGAVRIYLKHGVNVSANSVKRGTGGYDLYLSVNPRETDALRESSGYGDQIVETGMPRYDALIPGPKSRTLLFMPTWRRYLVPKLFGSSGEALVEFEGSTYEQFVLGFLSSPRLHDMLEKHDYRLQFLPHYNLAEYLASFEPSSDRISRADTSTTSFQDLIRGCDAFVTDHSSVHFDVAYLGTPVIYAHFDKDDYAEGHASVSWFEHERDGFGPVVYTLDDTLTALNDLLARGCEMEDVYKGRVDAAFTYRDQDNSKRVVQAIEDLIDRSHINP